MEACSHQGVLVFKKEELVPPAKRESSAHDCPWQGSDAITPNYLLLSFLHTLTRTHPVDRAGATLGVTAPDSRRALPGWVNPLPSSPERLLPTWPPSSGSMAVGIVQASKNPQRYRRVCFQADGLGPCHPLSCTWRSAGAHSFRGNVRRAASLLESSLLHLCTAEDAGRSPRRGLPLIGEPALRSFERPCGTVIEKQAPDRRAETPEPLPRHPFPSLRNGDNSDTDLIRC